MGAFAWVTLATNDSYSLGALVLAHSLKQAGTVHQLAVLVTPGVTSAMREKLSSVFNVVQEVNILDSRDEANLRLLKRPELGITFTKLHCWRLTQYEKCVFLDADTLVLQNSDELFEREELSAAPDVGWPDCFNSGVFVYRPSLDTYEKLIKFALEKGSFDGGDQGLLNLYFSDWAHKDISKHLPFIYNMCSTACYSYLPAFKQFGGNAKIIHFIGAQKPWLQYFNTETKKVQPSGDSSHLQEVLQRWWDIFCSLIHPHLSPAMAGLAGAFSQLTLGVARTPEQDLLENILRKQAWEVGNIDYLGKDSFENIWSKITETLSSAPSQPQAPAPEPEPSAPAESQSQTAPQEEAKPVQTPVLPLDTPADNVTSIDAPKIDSPVETQIEKVTAVTSTEPPQPSTQPEEVKAAVSDVETPKEITSATPAEKVVEPVAEPVTEPVTEPLVCPIVPKKEVVATPEPESVPAQAPTKTSSEVPQVPVVPSESSQVVDAALTSQEPVAEPSSALSPEPAISSPTSETSQSLSTPETPAPIVSPVASSPSAVETPTTELPKSPEPTVLGAAIVAPAAPEVKTSSVPQTQVIEATPPVTPATPPVAAATPPVIAAAPTSPPSAPSAAAPVESVASVATVVAPSAAPASTSSTPAKTSAAPATPPVEKPKQVLAAEAPIPDTPPPSEGGSTPTPPPRKTDKPKKVAAKPKK